MTDDRMALLELIEKQADVDLVREMLAAAVEGEEGMPPEPVAALAKPLLEQIPTPRARIDALEKRFRRRAVTDEAVRRLMTILGVGAITAPR